MKVEDFKAAAVRYVEWLKNRPDRQPANNKDPHCNYCWDKGYATYMRTIKVGLQRRDEVTKLFCHYCWRGREMEMKDAFERGREAGKREAQKWLR